MRMSERRGTPSSGVDAWQDLQCPYCGYELRDLPENRCPECGHAFDPDTVRWVMRRQFRAQWLLLVALVVLACPIGLVALVYSIRMERARMEHRLFDAQVLARRAEIWTIIAALSLVLFYGIVPYVVLILE